jgi:hypothetical protein
MVPVEGKRLVSEQAGLHLTDVVSFLNSLLIMISEILLSATKHKVAGFRLYTIRVSTEN